MLPTLSPFGIRFSYFSNESEVLDAVIKKNCDHILTINPEYIILARTDPSWRALLESTPSMIDGVGIIWLWRMHRLREKGCSHIWAFFLSVFSIIIHPARWSYEPHRMPGSEILSLLNYPENQYRSLYLLGGTSNEINGSFYYIKDNYPNLKVKGKNEGPLFQRSEIKHHIHTHICEKINASHAEVLLVAFGFPKQDEWIANWKSKLSCIKVAFGVGGSFAYWSNVALRAPEFIKKLGLEWLWRLCTQPWRFHRILNALSFLTCKHEIKYYR